MKTIRSFISSVLQNIRLRRSQKLAQKAARLELQKRWGIDLLSSMPGRVLRCGLDSLVSVDKELSTQAQLEAKDLSPPELR
jgi:hypothetical protein